MSLQLLQLKVSSTTLSCPQTVLVDHYFEKFTHDNNMASIDIDG